MNNKLKKCGIVATGSFIKDAASVHKGIDFLSSLGFEPVVSPNFFAVDRYMAGTAKQRAEDLMAFFRDPEITAIFEYCGGAGCQYLLDYLDYDDIIANPKPLVGFSDFTALQNGIFAMTGNISLSGFMLKKDCEHGTPCVATVAMLKEFFDKEAYTPGTLPSFWLYSGQTIVGGQAEGTLIGGNLTRFMQLMGTKYMPDITDSIILLEDIGEDTYRIDLMLNQLRQHPDFCDVKGIIFGEFINCSPQMPCDGTTDDVIKAFCKDLEIPVISNIAYGHSQIRNIFPIGGKILLNTDELMIASC